MAIANVGQSVLSQKALESEKTPRIENKELAKKYAEAEQAAQDFETMFVDMMLKAMRATAKPEEESNAHDIYQSMLDEEYAKNMSANGGGVGIKNMVLDWMRNADPQLRSLEKGNGAAGELKDQVRLSKQAIEQYKLQQNLR